MSSVLATENLWRAWSFQPLVIGAGLVAIGFFLHGWLRLHRRKPSLAPWTRIPLFIAGVVVTVLAIVSPIDAIGESYLQSVHMLQHVLIADLGIALTVVAVRGPLTVFLLPRDLLVPCVATENLWRAWSFQPLVIGAGLVAIGFFLHGWLRLHRRKPSLAPWTRIPLFVAGVVVTVLAIVSPIDAIGESYLQSVHMLQHVLIADLGIALTVVAVRGPLTVFLLPRDLLVPLAHVGWLRRLLRFLFRPGVSYAVWVVVLVAWHIPAFYEAALHHTAWHDLMHLSFVVGGLLVWTQIVDPSRHHRLTLNERVGYTALVFCTGQILAYVILFDFRPLFSTYVDQPVRLLGLSPLTDQKLAGVVMMVEQILTVGLAFVLLLRASRREQRVRLEVPATHQPVV